MKTRAPLVIAFCLTWAISSRAQSDPPSTKVSSECSSLLKNLTREGIERNVQLHNMTERLMQDLEQENGDLAILGSWAFRGELQYLQLMHISNAAENAGVKVLGEFSRQSSFQLANANQPILLATFVFSAPKEKLVQFFSSLRQQPDLILATYQILQTLPLRNTTAFKTFQVISLADRSAVLRQAIAASTKHLILFNDVRSKSFLALISPQIYEDYVQAAHRTPKITTVDEEQLVRSWNEFAPKVSVNESVLLIKEVHRSLAYVTSLSDLADVQLRRVTQFVDYQKLLSVVAGAPSEETFSTSTAVDQSIQSLTRTDFVMRRPAYFGPKGKIQLNTEKPAFQIRLRKYPEYVAFLPEWLKAASVENVERTYRHFAELPKDESTPSEIAQYVANFQKAKSLDSVPGFQSMSLSDLTPQKLTNYLKNGKPLILTPGRRDKTPHPLSFVLLPISGD